ncbi:replication initiation protein [Magnetovibrio sp. PR-2]|uniref:replication initiation protein n=1 Tax=Magnetovibrio sp. PR-2 TaxID=3120356 RepID=UPI002FCE31FF
MTDHIEVFFDDIGNVLVYPENFVNDVCGEAFWPIPFDNPIAKPESVKFPKPAWLIEASPVVEGFPLAVRRLQNFILCLSWDWLSNPEADYVFYAYASDVRRSIGNGADCGNQRLRKAFDQLSSVDMVFPSFGNVSVSLLEVGGVSECGEYAFWKFKNELRLPLSDEYKWGMINMAESLKLTSKYALSLYELARLYYRRKLNFRNTTPDELRLLLGVGNSLPTWTALKGRALEPAIKQIQDRTGLNIKFETERRRRTREVNKITLTFSKQKAA